MSQKLIAGHQLLDIFQMSLAHWVGCLNLTSFPGIIFYFFYFKAKIRFRKVFLGNLDEEISLVETDFTQI